jgi:tRNA threonylcarbamoyl adenosine modification protein YeaZ
MRLGYGLAIHTSSPDLGLAFSNFQDVTRTQTWDLGRELSQYLHGYLTTFLQPQTWSDLSFLAVAIGPGGFTGTRVGVVTARTLAQQLDIPLFGISSLAAIAWHTYQSSPDLQVELHRMGCVAIAVQMQASRGALHGGLYQIQSSPNHEARSVIPILADAVYTESAWQTQLEQQPTSVHLVTANQGLGISTLSLLQLAANAWIEGERPHWSTVLPIYGQSPVSEP